MISTALKISSLKKTNTKEGFRKFLTLLNDTNINETDPENGNSILHLAVEHGAEIIVKHLIAKGAKIDSVNIKKNTPLHVAILKKQVQNAKILIQNGANLHSKNGDGESPFTLARKFKSSKITLLIQDKMKNAKRKTVQAFNACRNGDLLEVQELLKEVDINSRHFSENTLLHVAAENGYTEIMEHLIKNGAKINVENKFGESPIHMSVQFNKLRSFQILIKNMDLDSLSKHNQADDGSILHFASSLNRLEFVKILLKQGVKVNLQNSDDFTPLSLAIKHGHCEVIKYLITQGAHAKEELKEAIGKLQTFDPKSIIHSYNVKLVEIAQALYDAGPGIRMYKRKSFLEFAKAKGIKKVVEVIIKKMVEESKPMSDSFEHENKRFKFEECIVCFEPRKEAFVFNPCGHAKTCETCCLRILHLSEGGPLCPVCRTTVTHYMRVFL